MALPLIALPSILTSIAAWWIRFELWRKVKMFLYSLSTWVFLVGLLITFILACYAALAAVQVAMPPQFGFAFGLIPPSAPALYGSYLALIASRRLLEIKAAFMLDVAATNKRASLLY